MGTSLTSVAEFPITEKDRFLALQTPLGPDKLLLRSFFGREAISQLFNFQLDLLSDDHNIDFGQVIGQSVTFGVRLADLVKLRYFNGVVSRFAQLPQEGRLAHYRADIVPQLWFLTRAQDCCIFQEKKVPEILADVFKKYGLNDVDWQLKGSYPKRDYCVQYRETSFAFVSRLMEEEGIFYFFRHENGKHTMVLADVASAYKPCPEQATARIQQVVGSGIVAATQQDDLILRWQLEQEMRPGRYALTDFNFEMPNNRLDASIQSTINQGGNTNFEIFDYPGEYDKRSEGDRLVKIRMEEEETPHAIVSGAGTCRSFITGHKFTLTGHQRRDQNGAYVLTAVDHRGQEGGFYSGVGGEEASSYENTFTAIPAAVVFRPARVTPRPVVQGSQTAIVTGPSGEEIYTDKHGRVKVQFHWDRLGQYNEKSSCWIRAAQSWAGKGWGAMWIPRVGQEVVVDFLEGDPDRPIITGRVYNGVQTPPYTLPGEQTKSTFKSYSSKGGGGFNEIRFEDKKGSEQLFLHAEKNYDARVKASAFESIGGERHLIIEKDQLELVKGDKHLHVKGDQNEKVDGTVSLKTGMDLQQKVGVNYALDAGMEIHLKAGMNVVIESGTTLTLKVGGNFVNINPGGVFISGTMIMLNSGGAAGSGAGASPQPPKDPKEADTAKPGEKAEPPPPPPPPKPSVYSPAAVVLKEAARTGAPFCDI